MGYDTKKNKFENHTYHSNTILEASKATLAFSLHCFEVLCIYPGDHSRTLMFVSNLGYKKWCDHEIP